MCPPNKSHSNIFRQIFPWSAVDKLCISSNPLTEQQFLISSVRKSDHRAVSFYGDPINPSPQARSLRQILFGLGTVKTNVIYVLLSAPGSSTSG